MNRNNFILLGGIVLALLFFLQIGQAGPLDTGPMARATFAVR